MMPDFLRKGQLLKQNCCLENKYLPQDHRSWPSCCVNVSFGIWQSVSCCLGVNQLDIHIRFTDARLPLPGPNLIQINCSFGCRFKTDRIISQPVIKQDLIKSNSLSQNFRARSLHFFIYIPTGSQISTFPVFWEITWLNKPSKGNQLLFRFLSLIFFTSPEQSHIYI